MKAWGGNAMRCPAVHMRKCPHRSTPFSASTWDIWSRFSIMLYHGCPTLWRYPAGARAPGRFNAGFGDAVAVQGSWVYSVHRHHNSGAEVRNRCEGLREQCKHERMRLGSSLDADIKVPLCRPVPESLRIGRELSKQF